MIPDRLKISVEEWLKHNEKGAIMLAADDINDRVHYLTKLIRQAKQAIIDAEKIYVAKKAKAEKEILEYEATQLTAKEQYDWILTQLKQQPHYSKPADVKPAPLPKPVPPKIPDLPKPDSPGFFKKKKKVLKTIEVEEDETGSG